MRFLFLLSFPFLLLLFFPLALHAQFAGSLDQSFNPIVSSHAVVTVVQPDGKILLGGYFIAVNGEPRCRLARLLPNGNLESATTFNMGSGANDWIDCMAIQPDGKILLAGRFTGINGQPRNHIARLNADGTLESTDTFNPGSGMGGIGYVWSIAVQPDGKILVGGLFTSVNGEPRNGIARLNADGSVEALSTFNAGTGANSNVVSMAVQTDGRILLAGDFTTINGQPRNHIARLHPNGSLESTATFNCSTGPGGGGYASVQTVALQPDGKSLSGK